MIETDKIRLGTSGYSFQDWIGPFYPPGIEKGQMLNFYAQKFSTVEVNSTYYRIPHPAVFYHMAEKTPDNFDFIVKVNKETTHTRKENAEACRLLLEAVMPLRESRKLSGFLAQFPYGFQNTTPNRKHLIETRQLLKDDPLFVEFRHDSWALPEVSRMLSDHAIGYVCVDEPPLGHMLPPQEIVTSDTGYVRFHGRNSETWWDQNKGNRYDYRYSKSELEDWKSRIYRILTQVKKLYLFFNNCHHGHAPENAFELSDILYG